VTWTPWISGQARPERSNADASCITGMVQCIGKIHTCLAIGQRTLHRFAVFDRDLGQREQMSQNCQHLRG